MRSSSVTSHAAGTVARPLRVTAKDLERLRRLVERAREGWESSAAEQLELELDAAIVTPQQAIPRDVVTMRSRITFQDIATGRLREMTLVYPGEADVAQSKVSVLAPIGLAMLGQRVGDVVEWPLPNGRRATLLVVEVLYQPEAAGDLEL